jgi:hypothetical protein
MHKIISILVISLSSAVVWGQGFRFSDTHIVPSQYSAPQIIVNNNGTVTFVPAHPTEFRRVETGMGLGIGRVNVHPRNPRQMIDARQDHRKFEEPRARTKQPQKPRFTDAQLAAARAAADSVDQDKALGIRMKSGAVWITKVGQTIKVQGVAYRVLGKDGDRIRLRSLQTGKVRRVPAAT